jgi:hypothetical protein
LFELRRQGGDTVGVSGRKILLLAAGLVSSAVMAVGMLAC